ncbi:unnamed protein product [Porites evermanni]|uniref:Ig-like domain-containing protein n=1 Tax=Porites evermanni TaxID=104178 RepID=A0ABN8RJG4_9CNID|nr:unnamed protein product [Porites evermanni]
MIYDTPAKFINVSSDQSVIEGGNLLLVCETSGKLAPNITWTKIGQESGENKILHLGTRYKIENVSRSDAGTYRCTSFNGVGNSVSHLLTVDVICKYGYNFKSLQFFIVKSVSYY